MRSFAATLFIALIAATAGAESWQPPEPEPGAFDWIRMNSGEWLGGELKGLRDLDLEFDSDELDLLTLDFSDVAVLRSPNIYSYVFDDVGTFTGTAVMHEGVIAISTTGGVVEQPRDKLLVILAGPQNESSYWSTRATIGAVTRSGNTDQYDFNMDLRIRRESPGSRLTLDYNGNYGKVNDDTTIDNNNGTITYDILIAAGFFITPVSVNLFSDKFQNIDLKSTASAGLGYDISRGGDLEWSVGLAGGYQKISYISVEEGTDSSETTGSIIPSTELNWDITDDLEFLILYNAQVGVPDVSNTFHHARATFSFDILGDIIDLDFGLNWDRVESPRPDADGNVPKRDDLRTTFGIGVDW